MGGSGGRGEKEREGGREGGREREGEREKERERERERECLCVHCLRKLHCLDKLNETTTETKILIVFEVLATCTCIIIIISFLPTLAMHRYSAETATKRATPLTTLSVSSVPPVAPTTLSAVEMRRYQWTPLWSASSSSREGEGGGEGAGRRGMGSEGQALLHQVSSRVLALSLSLSPLLHPNSENYCLFY